jgi:thiol-disulfide isomerase/thioredoxin
MRMLKTTPIIALAVVIGLALAGCSGGSTTGSLTTEGDGVRTVVAADKRGEPIEMSGTTLDGKQLNLAALRGKPVVLNIWGSWCPPCRKEAPSLAAAATQIGDKASFVGIDIRDHNDEALAYERRFEINYPSLVDKGDLLLSLRGAAPVQSPPITLVLDQQGRIAGRFVGPVTTLTLVDMVSDVTAAAAS